MASLPPEIEAFPPAPQRKNKDTFADLMDDVITWFERSVSKVGATGISAYQNTVAAAASASAAAAAAEAAIYTSGATQWVSGTTYAKGAVVWSPVTGRSYRRLAAGAATVDPGVDRFNWVALSFEPNVLASATISSPVANIDFLNIFSSEYDKYTIEIQSVAFSVATYLQLQLAYSGAVSTSNYVGLVGNGGGTSAGSSQIALHPGAQNPGSPITLTIEIRNANSLAGALKGIGCRGVWRAAADSSYYGLVSEGGHNGSGPASGFRLFTAGGTLNAGTIRVFGHKNI